MAEVFRYVDGEAIERLVARHEKSNAAVTVETRARGAVAQAKMSRHRDTGAARVEVEVDDFDGHITLVDEDAGAVEWEIGVLWEASN